jgi:hypothetical protein
MIAKKLHNFSFVLELWIVGGVAMHGERSCLDSFNRDFDSKEIFYVH